MPAPDNEELITDSVKNILHKIAADKELKNYSIKSNAGSIKGDNYLGVIVKVQLEGVRKGKNVTVDLIIKFAPKSEGLRNALAIDIAYIREIYIYNEFIPLIQNFQKKKSVESPLKCFAKCLATFSENMKEALVMEDITVFGFKMQNRRKPMDYYHSKLVLKELARLHAISFALKDQEPEKFQKVLADMKEDFLSKSKVDESKEVFSKRYDDVAETFAPQDSDALEKYKEVTPKLIIAMRELMKPATSGEHAVVCHGDSWINNILFRYQDSQNSNIPTDLCLLDWQISHIGSPLLDVFYYIYCCTDQQFRIEYFDVLMQEYYQTLSSFIRELGSEPEVLFPEDVFRQHMKKFALFGLCTAHMLIPLITSESDDIPEINDALDAGAEIQDVFVFDSKSKQYSMRRIRDVFLHMYQNGLI